MKQRVGLSLFIADKSDPLADGTVRDLDIDYENAVGSPRAAALGAGPDANKGRLIQVRFGCSLAWAGACRCSNDRLPGFVSS